MLFSCSIILLFVLHFIGLISGSLPNSSIQINDDETRIRNFPFSLHRSASINGTIWRGHLNVHYATLEKSNVLDLLRIHVRLHDVNRFINTSKLLLRVTSPIDAISFALPTGSGHSEYVVMLPGLDVHTAKPFIDNRSIYLVILVVANSNDILTYSISVKIYDRSQYNVMYIFNFFKNLTFFSTF